MLSQIRYNNRPFFSGSFSGFARHKHTFFSRLCSKSDIAKKNEQPENKSAQETMSQRLAPRERSVSRGTGATLVPEKIFQESKATKKIFIHTRTLDRLRVYLYVNTHNIHLVSAMVWVFSWQPPAAGASCAREDSSTAEEWW